MTAERSQLKDAPRFETEAPTSLNLFDFRREGRMEFEAVCQKTEALLGLKRQYSTAVAGIDRFLDLRTANLRVLERTTEDLGRQGLTFLRSASLSAFYLKMHDEFLTRGIAIEDTWSFFRQCLPIAFRIDDFVIKEGEKDYQGLVERLRRKDRNYLVLLAADIGRMRAKVAIPTWFTGTEADWKDFLTKYTNAVVYLKDFFTLYPDFPRLDSSDPLGVLSSEVLPDWLVDANDNPPQRHLVEQELNEDIAGANEIGKTISQIGPHRRALMQLIEGKGLKTLAFFEKRRKELFPSLTNFAGLISYLFFLSSTGYEEFDLDYRQIAAEPVEKVAQYRIYPEVAIERSINTFVQASVTALDKESLALWIEHALRRKGVIENAQEPVSPEFLSALSVVLQETNSDLLTSEETLRLRKERKPLFQVLNYDVRPFLELLDEDGREYLSELVGVWQGRQTKMEEVIWEMAEVVASRRDRMGQHPRPENFQTVFKRLNNFLARWLRSNYKWACRNLLEGIGAELKLEKRVADVAVIAIEAATVYLTDFLRTQYSAGDGGETAVVAPVSADLEAQELKELEEEVERGNLLGWKLYYSIDRSTNEASMREIKGTTLAEREKEFSSFLVREGVSCSIGAGSVVNALNWLVTVPESVEWVRPAKEIEASGERFKKLKRGAVRIFYVMDDNKKEIVFFVHQKKAWSYGF